MHTERRHARRRWLLGALLAAACGAAGGETLSERLARQSPWSGAWEGMFDGSRGTFELVFTVEDGALAGTIRNASAPGLEGPVSELEVDGEAIGFGSAGGSAYHVELRDGRLAGTGVTAGGGAFEIVLTPARP